MTTVEEIISKIPCPQFMHEVNNPSSQRKGKKVLTGK